MTDEEVQAMNKRMQMGWEPSTHQWRAVGQRCAEMPEMREAKIWGLREGFPTGVKEGVPVGSIDIVPYPQFFHFKAIKAQDLTYDEALALKTLMES